MSGAGSLFGDEEPSESSRPSRPEVAEPRNDDASSHLPHWSEPATGEIPQVIVELSGDHPLWMDGRPEVREEFPPMPERNVRPRAEYEPPHGEDDGFFVATTDAPSDREFVTPPDRRTRRRSQGAPSKGRAKPARSSRAESTRRATSPRGEGSSRRSGGRGGGAKSEGGRSRSKSILTGVALGIVVLGAFAAGAAVAEVLVAAAVTIAAAEYFSTIRRGGVQPATLVGLVAVVLIVAGGYLRGFPGIVDGLVVGVIVTMLWYLSGIIQTSPFEGMSRTIFGITWIGLLGGFASLILRPSDFGGHGVRLLLATLVVTSASDVFAYFGGQVLGKHKMAPSISPSKTYEGFAIGAVASVVLGFVISGHIHPLTPMDGLILGVVAAIVTPIGDLAESMIKRSLNVKDASNLLPGHGGFLDRIDGVLFMLPTAYFLFRFLHIG